MEESYLITGATGFVGSCITHKLVKRGKKVHVISRKKQGNWRLNDIRSKIYFHKSNLLDTNLPKLIKRINPTYVFHLATYGSMPNEMELNQIVTTNILGTANLIHSLNFKNIKLFVNTSSSAEYLSKKSAFKEDDHLGPMNDYAVSKVAQTLYCQKEAIRRNIPIITFRLFSVYGNFEEKTRLIPHTILHALNGWDIPLSNPRFVRDFIFVDDVVDAYLLACKKHLLPGEIFNIGSGSQHSVEQLVKLVLTLTKSNAKPLWGSVARQQRQIEPSIWTANIQKARGMIGWNPKYTLQAGLTQSINWFSNNQNLYVE